MIIRNFYFFYLCAQAPPCLNFSRNTGSQVLAFIFKQPPNLLPGLSPRLSPKSLTTLSNKAKVLLLPDNKTKISSKPSRLSLQIFESLLCLYKNNLFEFWVLLTNSNSLIDKLKCL